MPTRLRDRGYPPRFLRKAFGPAPRLGRLRALAMPYSRELERTNLAYENAWLRGVPLPA